MGISLTSRTIKMLNGQGYNVAENVERFNYYSKRSHDLFGVFDVLAVGRGETIAVQVTSRSNISARRKKMLAATEVIEECRRSGWKILIHGWDKKDRKFRVKEVDLTVEE